MTSPDLSMAQQIALLPPDQREEMLAGLDAEQLMQEWRFWARKGQLPPEMAWTLWLFMAGRGAGKAVCFSTPLPTPLPQIDYAGPMPLPLAERLSAPTGWITMGDVEVGTVLFDENGKPTTVTAVFDVWPEQAWRLHFSDGTYVDACGDHQWVTLDILDRKRLNRSHPRGGVEPTIPSDWAAKPSITTRELVDTLTYGPRNDRNHCVPLARPLVTERQPLLVEPWVLGYWLGNGSVRDGTVTTHNADEAFVRESMLAGGHRTGKRYGQETAAVFTPLGLLGNLKALSVLHNKHIPAQYLRASIEQREALLAGLLDSDGYIDEKKQSIEFGSKDEVLALGVAELARTLGQKPVVKKGVSKLYGVEKGPRFRVTWRPTSNPFRSPRKASLFRPPAGQGMRSQHRMIVGAEPVEPRPMRCVTVDSPNSMYLVGEGMIPTHNTRSAAEWLHQRVRDGHAKRIALLGRTAADVRDVMVQGDSGLVETARPGERPLWEPSKRRLTWPNGTYALAFSSDEPDQLRGPQFDTAWCLAEGEPVLTSRGWKPIETIRPGERVLTRSGYWPVAETAMRGEEPVLEVSTEASRTICSYDHRVLVGAMHPDRWTAATDLRDGDMLHVRRTDVKVEDLAAQNAVMLPVTSVVEAGTARVWTLSVNGMHEYFGGGLLSKNCIALGERVLVDDKWTPIEDVQVGQMAMTRQGPRRVTDKMFTGTNPILRVVTTNGTLRCTPDHRIWANGRWVYARDLLPGDMVRTWTREGMTRLQDRPTSTPGAESVGTTIQRTGTTGTPAGTSFMSRYGKRRTARARKGRASSSTSTTATRTRRTTLSTTLNSELAENTSPTTERASRRSRLVAPSRRSRAARRRGRIAFPRSGRASSVEPRLSPDPYGLRSTARGGAAGFSMKPILNSRRSVQSAGRPSGSTDQMTRRSTALDLASARSALGPAITAGRSSRRRLDRSGSVPISVEPLGRVLSVAPDGKSPTWDLTVSQEHEFFSENLLTHNCDEFASFPQIAGVDGATAFDNLRLGLRLPVDGDMPRMVATTTPRRVPSMFKVLEESKDPRFGIAITRGTTYDNLANLADAYSATILGLYEGTRLGRQELMGEMLSDVEGALFKQEFFDINRVPELPEGRYITVVGVDPSVAERPKDECGIVVVKATTDRDYFRRQVYVMEDASLLGSPAAWSKVAVAMAAKWAAPIVAEGNQGGALVRMAIGQVNPNVPVYIVHAKEGKATRAEPVAALGEQGRLHLVGFHPMLEAQATSWVPAETKDSPDRVDAMVWAVLATITKIKGATFGTNRSLRARSFRDRRLPQVTTASMMTRPRR